MKPTTVVRHPPLKYFGSKWRIAPWIISHFPEHDHYIEPCGGGASVLLRKSESSLESYNDIDGDVVNLFRVIREQPEELIRLLDLTPWAEDEFKFCLQPCENRLERARRFLASNMMCIHGGNKEDMSSWRRTIGYRTIGDAPKKKRNKRIISIEGVTKRLKSVQIFNRSYDYFLSEKYDRESHLVYIDPPYLHETRRSSQKYAHEWDNSEHEKLFELVKDMVSMVVISGYNCSLYRDMYEGGGWIRHDKDARINGGKTRVESIWINQACREKLKKPTQRGLFG
ncbi:MAG: DNA adenine methylase [bacterium]|nr:DNA adenine methylase [bacterium]